MQKKICMLGGFAVGKTSLVRRFVQSIFSDTYLTTVGVKIDKKSVALPDKTVDLILWDLAGEDDIGSFRVSNVRGATGLVLVVDGKPAPLLLPWRSLCASGPRPNSALCRLYCCSTNPTWPIGGQYRIVRLTNSGNLDGKSI